MDGNSSERGRHRHRAHQQPAAEASPQWTAPLSAERDGRPEWTPPEPRSWFEKPVARPADPPRAPEAQWAPAWTPGPPAVPPGPSGWDTPATPETDTGLPSWTPAAPGTPGAGAALTASSPAAPGAPEAGAGLPAWAPGDTGAGLPGWSPQAAGELTGPIDMGSEPPVARWGAVEAPAGASRWGAEAAAPETPAGATRWDGGGQPRAHAVKHPLRLALFTLVLLGLVAGSVAWLTMDKSVRLTVDGEARTVSTYASTVSGVLDDAGVTVAEHDTLAPAADTKVSDGAEIVLRRGRLVTLTVDGTPRKVWVTATTVEEALSQVGYRQDGMFVSANRSTRLPLEGYELTLRTPKRVTIIADGRKHPVTTTAPTVGEAMAEAGVTVDADDRVSQLAEAAVRPGMTVTVTRVSTRTRTTEAVVQYDTIEQTDPKAEVGSRTVKTKGVTGLRQVTKVETYVDGKLTSSKVAKVTVLRTVVDEVVVVGPEPPEPPPTQPTQPAECADFPTTGGLNWCGLAKCESGLNPNAYNPAGPYYGLYQFDQGTWTSNGGSGSPSGKSIAEQTAVAWTLYQARGASPWPVCGRNL